jgi:hypothetical protein
VIGLSIDPALGGGHAMVVADLREKLWILDCLTVYGLSRTEEQLELLGQFVAMYKPSIVVVEFDSQQKGLGNDERMKRMGERYGFTIRPHITKGQKMDEIFGVASMDQSFKLGDIRIPYGDDETQARMAHLITQLRAWRPDIKTKMLTQDLVMALWFLWRVWMKVKKEQEPVPVPIVSRPSWIMHEDAYRGKPLTHV